jgi:hypothetical protein
MAQTFTSGGSTQSQEECRFHRSLLRTLLAEQGATLADGDAGQV